MLELFVELIFEFVFQLFIELIGVLFDGRFNLSARRASSFFKVLLYSVIGCGLGYVSYLVMPYTFTGQVPNPLISLVIVPAGVGAACTAVGRWSEDRWDWNVGVSKFVFGFVLAWTFAGTRFLLLKGII